MPSTTPPRPGVLPVLLVLLGLLTPALATGTAHAEPGTSAGSTTTSTTSAAQPASRPRNGYGVRLTTFNILSSAMARGGVDRAARAARWVQKQDATAAAFQEVAKDQLRHMQRSMPGYNFFPRRSLGTRGSAIQIAWKTSEVKLMETGHVMRPFLGWQRPIPYVRLKDRETGRGFWVMAIHNAPGGHETERDVSTARGDRADQEDARQGPPGVRDRRRQRALGVLLQGRRRHPAGLDERRHRPRSRARCRASAARTGCSARARSSPASPRSTTASATTRRSPPAAWVPSKN